MTSLRTDIFKTVKRHETRFICVRDSLTPQDRTTTVQDLDTIHCRAGRLGLGWHFVILTEGDIALGRDIHTCGAHSRDYDTISVAVGLVGGVVIDEKGKRTTVNTRTEDQLEALDDLLEVLLELFPEAQVHDTPR